MARRLANDLQQVRNVLNEEDRLETVILVIACDRFEALKEHLELLKKFVTFSYKSANMLIFTKPLRIT